AEWNLARALLVAGKGGEALVRINRLLADNAGAAIPPALRAKLGWLRIRLALEAKELEPALGLVEALVKSLADVDPALAQEIASSALLGKAQAEFDLEREPAALATLQRVRTAYPKSDAAIKSYLIEADFY